jgi:hypothetical protein
MPSILIIWESFEVGYDAKNNIKITSEIHSSSEMLWRMNVRYASMQHSLSPKEFIHAWYHVDFFTHLSFFGPHALNI